MLSVERFRDELGFYTAPDGCQYDSAARLLQCGILDFCGCGTPMANLRYVRDGLYHIARRSDDGINSMESRQVWNEAGFKLFGNENAAQFFYYWANKEELAAHGTSVPGWLTERGKQLLTDLNEVIQNLDNPS